MRVVCISDTHMYHSRLEIPEGDLLVHAGDCCGAGTILEALEVLKWLQNLPHEHKVLVPGNHDAAFEYDDLCEVFKEKANVDVLKDCKKVLQVGPRRVSGFPWTPDFYPDRWAFNYVHAPASPETMWGSVCPATDILVSHGPPLGWGDQVRTGTPQLGCRHTADAIDRINPELFVCGHIHGGYGQHQEPGGTIMVNASICTEQYKPTNKPITVDL